MPRVELVDSLAQHLRESNWIALTEMPLGSVLHDPQTPRADVIALKKSYRVRIVIYEVKGNKDDFRRDVNNGKYEKYLPYCHQLYFAAPRGELKPIAVPYDCGLIVLGDRSWSVVKAAPIRRLTQFDSMFLLACLFRQAEEKEGRRSRLERARVLESATNRQLLEEIGGKVAQRLRALMGELEEVEKAKDLINKFLGMETTSLWQAVFRLEQYLDSEVPGAKNLHLAARLVKLAAELVNAPARFNPEDLQHLREATKKDA